MHRRQFLQSLSALLFLQPFPNRRKRYDSIFDDLQLKVCDVHMHLIGLSPKNGCYINNKTQKSIVYRLQKLFLKIDSNGSLEDQDRHYVDWLISTIESSPDHHSGILLAMDGVYDASGRLDEVQTPFLIPNDYLFNITGRSQKLFPGASVNPFRRDALTELDRVAEKGAIFIKWIPNSQAIDPSDKKLVPFYRKMVEVGLPLLSHCGTEYAIPAYDQKLGNPKLLQLPLEEGVKVIVAHCAVDGRDENGSYFFHFLEMLESYPNLMGEISALSLLYKIHRLRYLLDNPSYFDRLYYGSDFPLQFFPATSPYYFLGRMTLEEAAEIQAIDNVLARNVATLYKIGVPRDCLERGLVLLK